MKKALRHFGRMIAEDTPCWALLFLLLWPITLLAFMLCEKLIEEP